MATKTPVDHTNLDRQIEEILKCKPLPESEIKALCEKVPLSLPRPRRSLLSSPMWCPYALQSSSAVTSTASSTT